MARRSTPPFRADHVGSLLRRAEWHTDFIRQLGGFRQAETFRTIHAFGASQPLSYDAHGMEVTGTARLPVSGATPITTLRSAQPRRCDSVVVRTTTESHRRG